MKIDSSIPIFDTPAVQPGRLGDLQKHRELIQAVRSAGSADLFGANEIIRILNRETKEVIDQIPWEQGLQLAKSLSLLRAGPSQATALNAGAGRQRPKPILKATPRSQARTPIDGAVMMPRNSLTARRRGI